MSELVGVTCAGPMDKLCAEAVRELASSGQPPDLQQFLNLLPEDRALGIFYALQPPKRKTLLRRDYWRELVATGPASELIKEVGMEIADADGLGVSPWMREAWPHVLPVVADG